ncbi:MAG: patatin-like phospholipase family protein [Chloroflexi bacterium]|nr:patatin-like phospholipase family protein [Chloroflexota bacterium]
MIAFALSGGGSRGALQAGALLALLERGIRPQILVGTSAGALNAAFLAIDPTLERTRQLAEIWSKVRRESFFPRTNIGLWLNMGWNFLTGSDGLLSSDKVHTFIEKNIPPQIRHFGDIKGARLYVTAADINWGVLYLWGDLPEGDLVEALLASSAAPAIFPPRVSAGHQLVDGAVVASVPVAIAAAKGATEVYAINVGYAGQPKPLTRGAINIANRAISTLIYQQLLEDIEEMGEEVLLHHIAIDSFQGMPLWELGQGAKMVEEGYRIMQGYLDTPAWERSPRARSVSAPDIPPPPPGAVVWQTRRRYR